MSIRSKLNLILFVFALTAAAMAEDADNTVRNDRERSKAEKTPVDQNENKRDLELTRTLRKTIVADKSLSTYAHNIKIMTQNGVINLKGPVRSANEKTTIERMAGEVAGANNVKSNLEIAPETDRAIDTSVDRNRSEKKADNTEVNQRERNATEKTPVNQNENKSDLEITRQIRKAIIADKSLSTYARNIKIITQDGVVNLKGPVRTAEEKASVESKAASVAGQGKVESQIEVAPKDAK